MRSASLAFSRNLEYLRFYLQSLEMESELLSKKVISSIPSELENALLNLQNHLYRSAASKRRFDYNSVIVSLYGFLEQYIEELLREYTTAISEIVPLYNDLPEKIVKHHIELSYTLITRIEQSRYKSLATTQQIIANLHSCMSNPGNYKINSEAFSHHTANFRTEVIDRSFATVGVERVSEKIKDTYAFREYQKIIDPNREPGSINSQEAFFIIEDLADRRNDVAHGVTAEILSNEILLDYVTFFEAYGNAIYDVIRRETLPYKIKYQSSVQLGKAIKVFNNSIVCLSLHNVGIKVGDTLVSQTPDNNYYDGIIEELQIDKVSYQEIEPRDSVTIGIKVPFKAKENQTFILLPQRGGVT